MRLFNWFKKKKEVKEEENDPMQTIIDNDQEMGLWDTTIADGLEDEEWDEEEEPNEALKQAAEVYKATFEVNELDVDGDNKITIEDLHAAQLKLKDPNLPPHKRDYWENIVKQLKRELSAQNPEEDIKTYN